MYALMSGLMRTSRPSLPQTLQQPSRRADTLLRLIVATRNSFALAGTTRHLRLHSAHVPQPCNARFVRCGDRFTIHLRPVEAQHAKHAGPAMGSQWDFNPATAGFETTRTQGASIVLTQPSSLRSGVPTNLSWRCATVESSTCPPPPPGPPFQGKDLPRQRCSCVQSHVVLRVEILSARRVSIGWARPLHGLAACAPQTGTETSRSSSTPARMKRTSSRTRTTSGPCGMCVVSSTASTAA